MDILTESFLIGEDRWKQWDHAQAMETILNDGEENSSSYPTWMFDCGFKLDYDGPLVSINSRFYPNNTKDNKINWNGTVTCFLAKGMVEKTFEASDLDELKARVDEYIKSVNKILNTTITELRKL